MCFWLIKVSLKLSAPWGACVYFTLLKFWGLPVESQFYKVKLGHLIGCMSRAAFIIVLFDLLRPIFHQFNVFKEQNILRLRGFTVRLLQNLVYRKCGKVFT